MVLQISGFGLHHFRRIEDQEILKGTEKYYRGKTDDKIAIIAIQQA